MASPSQADPRPPGTRHNRHGPASPPATTPTANARGRGGQGRMRMKYRNAHVRQHRTRTGVEHVSEAAEQLAFEGPGRVIAPAAVMTAHHGRNDAMIANVARLYIPDGATVIDCTWGKGNFWRRTDTSRFHLIGSDLVSPSARVRADFRDAPVRRCQHGRRRPRPALHPRARAAPLHRDPVPQPRDDARPRHPCGRHGAVSRRHRRGGARAAPRRHVLGQMPGHGREPRSALVAHRRARGRGSHRPDSTGPVRAHDRHATRRNAAGRQHHARRNHSYLWIFAKRRTAIP